MIAVIADDFTGAAELAGISLEYGLTVELNLSKIIPVDADVLIISTDSRSLNKEDAIKTTAEVVQAVAGLKPSFIYKKIDSVLRGHVMDELKIQMRLTGFNKAFILPANPSLGRTVSNGEYFVDGRHIHETAFAADPEFPITSSSISKMLNDDEVIVLKHDDRLPEDGIVVGEAVTADDVTAWADRIDKTWMLVGAGDFYKTILQKHYNVQAKDNFKMELPYLYVCGTAFDKSKNFIEEVDEELGCVVWLTKEMIKEENAENKERLKQIGNILKKHNKAIIAFNETDIPSSASALSLRTTMAKAVKQVIKQEGIKELFIEGGSTAAAILNELGVKKLSVINELQRGIVRMKANDLYITVKPGSYQLPEQIEQLYLSK
jgi:uncharacterized protein YgbK (DUF1537 family)